MLDLNAFAKEVHAVAVEHGWWEGEENNDIDTKIALIHAEWSEALEEYRAGRPMVWFECTYDGSVCSDDVVCDHLVGNDCDCGNRYDKPEGIAVELVDGCIRIMDFMEHENIQMDWEWIRDAVLLRFDPEDEPYFGEFVASLHAMTAAAVRDDCYETLITAIGAVISWVKWHGVDPWELLRIKHEYNKTRSYRHGGKRC